MQGKQSIRLATALAATDSALLSPSPTCVRGMAFSLFSSLGVRLVGGTAKKTSSYVFK